MFEDAGMLDPAWLDEPADDADFDWSPSDGLDVEPSAQDLLQLVLSADPCPSTISMLEMVGRMEITEAEAIDLAQAWERQAAWIEAQRTRSVARIAGLETPPHDEIDDGEILVAAALCLSARTAAIRVEHARSLTGRFTATLDTLERGDITWSHARSVLEFLGDRTAAVALRVEAAVLRRAAGQSLATFRRALKRELLRADSPAERDRRQAKLESQRGVRFEETADGLGVIDAVMPVTDAHFVWSALRAEAKKMRDADKAELKAAKAAGTAPRDARVESMDVYLTLALRMWARRATEAPDAPTPRGLPVTVQVVIDLPILLGLQDNPVEIRGLGSVPAAVGRELAADAQWRRLVVEPVTGYLLDYGTTTYRPPKVLADYILARDGTCSFVTCNVPAYQCEIDHLEPFRRPGDPPDSGGHTSADNNDPKCKPHHQVKTRGIWRTTRMPDGGTRWTHRSGWSCVTPPPRVLPD